jgi:bacillithiol system protein YtxJ
MPYNGGVRGGERAVALKDRIQLLKTPEEVGAFLRRNPDSALFKAGNCHKTPKAFAHVETVLGPREDLPLGVIRVVESRPASHYVEELTSVRHESPQLFLFKDGRAVFDRDNWDITAEALRDALEGHFERV